jgi:hypothetical protein
LLLLLLRMRVLVAPAQQRPPAAAAAGGMRVVASVPRVARVLRVAMEAGVELSPDEVAAEVREGLVSEHRMRTDGMDGEGLISLMGDDMAKKVVRAFLARRHQASATPPATEPEAKPRVTEDNLRGSPRFFR